MAAGRRSLGRSGSKATGMVLGMDVTGDTVRKWEVKLRAAQLQAFRAFQAAAIGVVATVPPTLD